MFLTIILSFLYNVFKKPSLSRLSKLAQTYMRGINFFLSKKCFKSSFSSSSTMFSKNFPILDCQNLCMFGTQTYTRGIDFFLSKKCSMFPLQCFQKTFPFWIVKTQECLVPKLTQDVSISSSAKNLDMPVWSIWSKVCFQ